MKIDYQDIASLIENIVEQAENEGGSILSILDLYEYLEDNYSNTIEILKKVKS
jgi:hypothetical protein